MSETPTLSPLGKALVALNSRMNLENLLNMELEDDETSISDAEEDEDLISVNGRKSLANNYLTAKLAYSLGKLPISL
eukprot:CAMPEP_0205807272 /NCGR_PEP_ID=MMETSP0205-20121125/10986_1 /ASSEMBLY_ACC=CAM_ASM_000278 /TAXON_ID=36767 /ORGANISM="Euplotes focardii, Strain TN1" /LENGTH=76 /DNA_ID=CAMNT_0053081305 /DNA_START=113 /DNA_END=343 /DNA_ORIENTATION=+